MHLLQTVKNECRTVHKPGCLEPGMDGGWHIKVGSWRDRKEVAIEGFILTKEV